MSRVLRVVGSSSFAFSVNFTLFSQTHTFIFLLNIIVLTLFQDMHIARPFESCETLTQIYFLNFILFIELDKQLFSAGDPVEGSADHAEFGETLEVKEVGDAEHALEVAYDRVAVRDFHCLLRSDFAQLDRLGAQTSTDAKFRSFFHSLNRLTVTPLLDNHSPAGITLRFGRTYLILLELSATHKLVFFILILNILTNDVFRCSTTHLINIKNYIEKLLG